MITFEESLFYNFIVKYSYKASELSEVSEIVRYLYPQLLYIASQHKIDFDNMETTLYSQRYKKYEAKKIFLLKAYNMTKVEEHKFYDYLQNEN